MDFSDRAAVTVVASSPLLDIRREDESRLVALLRCSGCSKLASDAVETRCCRVLLCSGHQTGVCPACRRACGASVPNHLARRLIGSQPWRRAEEAGQAWPGASGAQRRPAVCPSVGCQFVADTSERLLDHLVTEHGSRLVKEARRMFPGGGGASVDRTAARNGRRTARDPSRSYLDLTGKHYCSGRLNGPPCQCCNGSCGPSNGCNCIECMRLDLVTFGVAAGEAALVNREGVVARFSRHAGKFYCGRSNMGQDATISGLCGPDSGNNCHACRQLDTQAWERYGGICENWDLWE